VIKIIENKEKKQMRDNVIANFVRTENSVQRDVRN
jgi:hypothetical protein